MRYFKTFYRQSKETGTGIQKTFTSFRRFGRKGLPAFLLTGDSRHGNIKPASQEANFISGEEAAMKTRVRELRTAAGMTQQQLAEAVRVPLADAGLPHGGGLRHHRGRAVLPAGEPGTGGSAL